MIMYSIKWLFVWGVQERECTISDDQRIAVYRAGPDSPGDQMEIGTECFYTRLAADDAARKRIVYTLEATRTLLITLECVAAELGVGGRPGYCNRHAPTSINALGKTKGRPGWGGYTDTCAHKES